MPRNERRWQRALLKKHARDARRKKARLLAVQGMGHDDAYNKVLAAGKYPIHECLINPSWQNKGLAQIMVSRRQPDGHIVFGVYFVDLLCLGLKNTFCNANFSPSEYADAKARIFAQMGQVNCEVPLARRIVYGAIDYASKLGFKPQEDFEESRRVLGEEDEGGAGPRPEVEFGKEGKPLFIAGPDDDAELIMKQLETRLGPGNFEYIVPVELSP